LRITRKAVLASVATVSVLALAACSGADEGTGDDDNAGINTDTAITIAWNQPFSSFNGESITGNATANNIITYMANSRFNDYNTDLELVIDESWGTYEKVSDDPLTVTYTYADTALWSDGVAGSPADLLLEWAAQSGKFNNVEPEYDDEGNITNQEALDAGVYFDAASPAVALITETLEIDGDSITLVYSKPYADWEVAIDNNLPAHIVAQRALGIEDPEEATEALVTAITEENVQDLSKIAKVWSDDWNFASLPDDPQLLVTSGAYTITEFVEEQYLTLTANPDYAGDRPAVFEKVTIRYNGDPMGQVQALQNGEVDLISPQSTADVLTALEAIDGLSVETNVEGTYEHVDLQQGNGGPFDPATYGGDAETAHKVRQAFLKTIPRDKIVSDLIVPLNPDAEVRNSYTQVPGSPMYDGIVDANGQVEQYGEVDIPGAQELLAEAGVPAVQVRLLFDPNNTRRVNQYELIKGSAAEAGFDVVPYTVQTNWGADLSNAKSFYDAALFGWQSTSTAVTDSDANYRTGATNNYFGYSNPEVDALYDELQTETDPAEQERILGEVEKHLVDDAFGVTIFQHPGVTAWNPDKIGDVQKLGIAPTIFYGFWEWTAGDAATEGATE